MFGIETYIGTKTRLFACYQKVFGIEAYICTKTRLLACYQKVLGAVLVLYSHWDTILGHYYKV